MSPFHIIRRLGAFAVAATLSLASPAHAQNAGYRTFSVAGDLPMTVALFYPTPSAARDLRMGPWRPVVAPGAPASEAPLRGLVLISHGTGGTELNHHDLAARLAREGYLVAAVRHPGDNWEDRSLVASSRYFSERPRQLSRVLDALLASPEWGARIPRQRIGAVGHSAGGYGVLALAGARAEPRRAVQHCLAVQDDPVFCSLARPPGGPGGQASRARSEPVDEGAASREPPASVADPRIRAVIALAPMAVVFTPESLAAIEVPVRVMVAERDAVLNRKYHADHVLAHLPAASAETVAGAGHFAFMARSSIPLPSAAGDAAADPPGFDRAAFLLQLEDRVAAFFAEQLR